MRSGAALVSLTAAFCIIAVILSALALNQPRLMISRGEGWRHLQTTESPDHVESGVASTVSGIETLASRFDVDLEAFMDLKLDDEVILWVAWPYSPECPNGVLKHVVFGEQTIDFEFFASEKRFLPAPCPAPTEARVAVLAVDRDRLPAGEFTVMGSTARFEIESAR